MYEVGDKVEFFDRGRKRSAYLVAISTSKYRTQPGVLWVLKLSRTGHEFCLYESDIIQKLSSNFEGYNKPKEKG